MLLSVPPSRKAQDRLITRPKYICRIMSGVLNLKHALPQEPVFNSGENQMLQGEMQETTQQTDRHAITCLSLSITF